jgi:alpha-tubulin suppressor-like RCC1 family protein
LIDRHPRILTVLALAISLVSGCTYKSQPSDGRQSCGTSPGKQCPDGYFCASDRYCWKTGHGPDSGPVTSGDASLEAVDSSSADSRKESTDAGIDSRDAGADESPRTCDAGTHSCSGACLANDTDHCGSTCEKCIVPTGGTATCDGTQCGFDCGTLKKCNSKCVAGCCIDTDCPAQGGKAGQCDTSTNTCAYSTCVAGFKPCAALCVTLDKCCSANDCTGTCATCSAPGGTCVPVKSQDDADSCAGTCDATGVCKSKQGQTCQTTANGCVSGTTCAPDGYCCNTACSRSCEACDLPGFLGTCIPVASGAPHGNRAGCGTDVTCEGQCAARTDAQCSYPAGPCGAVATCAGVNAVDQGMCTSGACVAPAAHACAGGFACSGNACRVSCTADADCLPDYFCRAGTCHRDAKQVAIGNNHVCVLLVDGSVRCWGSNSTGQVGNGTTAPSPLPAIVIGLQGATSITAGADYTLALMPDGTLRQWGQVYTGPGLISIVTSQSQITSINGATDVSASDSFHNCIALSDRTAQCWGYNFGGALGNGDTASVFSGVPVTVKNLTGVTAITAGATFACAIESGSAQCWGTNSIGQLGNGSTDNSAIPVPVFGLAGGVAAISASKYGDHVCAIQPSSAVQCWGFNFDGQLGNGTTTPTPSSPQATPVTVTGISGARALALGTDHTCALLTGGLVRCWGANESGQLGNGVTTDAPLPQVVSIEGDAVSIAAGPDSTCAVVSNGSVVCWGLGNELGLPTNALTPTATPDW